MPLVKKIIIVIFAGEKYCQLSRPTCINNTCFIREGGKEVAGIASERKRKKKKKEVSKVSKNGRT